MEYKTPEYQEIFYMPKRCKAQCRHRRECFGWDGHMYNHAFELACRYCATNFYSIMREMSEELMGL